MLRTKMNMAACSDMFGWMIQWLMPSLSDSAMLILIPTRQMLNTRRISFKWRMKHGSISGGCGAVIRIK